MFSGAILAAGRGSRLVKISGGVPKAFVKVFSKQLLTFQARSLKAFGASNLVVITSPMWVAEASALMQSVTPNYLVVSNYRNFLENGYSFYLSLKHSLSFSNKAVITVVDHLYEREVIKEVLEELNNGTPLVVAGDKNPIYINISEATKIRKSSEGLVISKSLRKWEWVDMGVFGASSEALELINKCLNPNPKIAEVITCLSRYIRVEVVEFDGIKWCDIDNLYDYLNLYYGRRREIIKYLKEELIS